MPEQKRTYETGARPLQLQNRPSKEEQPGENDPRRPSRGVKGGRTQAPPPRELVLRLIDWFKQG